MSSPVRATARESATEPAGVPALKLEGVHAGYGGLRVLHDVSLEVGHNEVVSVIGANGAGKTTLLRAIAGVLRAGEGTIEFFGERVERRPSHELTKAGIGHVPSGRELFPMLTVEDNLQLGAYGVPRERRQELHDGVLELFPALGNMLKRDAGALSGGQQQMLAVGRALMTDPRLLLLDEPSTGLAPKIVASLFDALRQLLHRGDMSILLVEQNVGLALSLARRAYVLETGRIVVSGEAEALKQDERVLAAYLG